MFRPLSCRRTPSIQELHPAFFSNGSPAVTSKPRKGPKRDARGRFIKA